jgi:hypothetical protein
MKLTEVGRAIVGAVAAGNFPAVAARLSGISPGTLSKWLERGEESEQPYRDFAEGIPQRRGDARIRSGVFSASSPK